MGVLSCDIYNDELSETWVAVIAKITNQYPGRRIVVHWEFIFRNGLRKEESFDVSLGADKTDWGNTTIDDLASSCMKSMQFSINLYTVYYGQTIIKTLIR